MTIARQLNAYAMVDLKVKIKIYACVTDMKNTS